MLVCVLVAPVATHLVLTTTKLMLVYHMFLANASVLASFLAKKWQW